MTKRNKAVLFTSIFLALCVIATAIFNLRYGSVAGSINTRSLIIIMCIIILSIASVPVIYFSRVRKSKFEAMLNDEYFHKYEVIKDIIAYSQLSNISKKEIKEDVLDILITAQNSGKSANDAVGDPESFSQNILLAFAKPGRLSILNIIDAVVYFASFILGASIILWFEQSSKNLFDMGIDISMLVFFFVISFILIPVMKRFASTRNYWIFVLPLVFGIAFILLAEIARRFFYDSAIVRQLLDGTVRMIPNIVILVLYVILIPVLLSLKKYIRKRLLQSAG